MIYTITFNPALDYIMNVTDYHEGMVNRSHNERYLVGGKGVNVSIVLGNLGIPSTALGFAAGFTGREILAKLKEYNIMSDFVELPTGLSRVNVKLKSDAETEINADGPEIDEKSLALLMEKIEAIKSGDMLVIAGSVPSGLKKTVYRDILRIADGKGVNTIVDTTGELLTGTLEYHPFLIKPNQYELCEIFGRRLKCDGDIITAAYELQERGARNVLVSMGGDGAILICEDKSVFKHAAPRGKPVNSTGAGDSMVAGFIAGYMEEHNLKKALLMGISAGSASVFSEYLATKDEIMKIYNEIREGYLLP